VPVAGKIRARSFAEASYSAAATACVAATLCLFSLLGESLKASVTVNYTAQSGQRNVVDSGGNLISEGHQVRIGYFDPGFDLDRDAGDLVALDASWHQFDSTTIRVIQEQPSRFSRSSPGLCDPQFNSRRIHLWILMTSDGSAPLPDYSNVLEFGIFTSSATSWLFPQHNSLPGLNNTQINTSQVDDAAGRQGSIEAGSLKLSPNPNPAFPTYESWARNAFPEGTPDTDKSRHADPDCDGVSNLLERFGGTDPLRSDAGSGRIRVEEGNTVFTFRRSKHVDPASGVVQISGDLQFWQVSLLELLVVSDFEFHQILSLTIPLDTEESTYIRLSVRD
jgi:hypothetical protein